MRSLAAVVIVAGALAAPVAGSTAPSTITAASIGGARLGKQQSYYVSKFGRSYRVEYLENGYRRLTYAKLRLYVYFHRGTRGAVAIITSGRKFRTPEHVGPCSPADALATYPGANKVYTGPAANGRQATVYRLGRLLFGVERNSVVAVGLSPTRRAVFLTLTAPACR